MTTTVDLVRLGKRYGATSAVDDITMCFEPGVITAVLGPSGSGKTTMLEMIAGITEPSCGDVRFDGRSVLSLPAPKREAVMVFQRPLLFPYLSVADNVAFGLRMRDTPRSELPGRVSEMLEQVGLAGFESRRPAELSGGQEQRVALARALVVQPRVLLLDEPLTNLDPDLRQEMRDLIHRLQRERTLTVVLVTHDEEDAVAADRIALLLDGRLHQHGSLRDLFERPASARAAGYFGGATLIPGHRRDDFVTTPLGNLIIAGGSAGDGEVLVVVRPESVQIDAGGVPSNTCKGRLQAVEYRGSSTRVTVNVDGFQLEAVLPPHPETSMVVGRHVSITLPPARLWAVPRSD
jgi:putative spermidine/putrescine transport system ATP-binding protein